MPEGHDSNPQNVHPRWIVRAFTLSGSSKIFWLCTIIGMAIGIVALKRTHGVELTIVCVIGGMFAGLFLSSK